MSTRKLQVHLHWSGLPMISTAVRLLHDLFDASSTLETTMGWNATCTSQYDCTGMPRLQYSLTEADNQSTLTLLNPFDHPISEECVTLLCELVPKSRLFPRFQIGRVNVELDYLDRVFAALCQPDDPAAVEIERKGMVTITLPGSSLYFDLDFSDKAACIGWLRVIGKNVCDFDMAEYWCRYPAFISSLVLCCPQMNKLALPVRHLSDLMSASLASGKRYTEHLVLSDQSKSSRQALASALNNPQDPFTRKISKVTIVSDVYWENMLVKPETIAILEALPHLTRPLKIEFTRLTWWDQLRYLTSEVEAMWSNGNLIVLVPLSRGCRFAALTVFQTRGAFLDRGVVELIFAFSVSIVQHTITLVPETLEERRKRWAESGCHI